MKDKKKLYPDLPDNLTEVSKDDLAKLRQEFVDQIAKVVARDESVLGDLSVVDVREQNTYAKESVEKIDVETSAREVLETEFEAELADLATAVGVKAEEDPDPDPDPDPEAEEVEAPAEVVAEDPASEEQPAEVIEEKVPVLASGNQRAARSARPRATAKHEPLPDEGDSKTPLRLMASGLPTAHGSELSEKGLQEAMLSAWGPTDAHDEKVLIARADYSDHYPERRRLGIGDESVFDIGKRIDEVVGEEALVASGGLCAPVTPYYDLANVSIAERPVRDALASFNATRGGLQFARPATLASVTGGVGVKTAAQDALGGTNATKTCLAVTCPSFQTVNLEMIYRCFTFGNLNARSFPELITQWTDLAIAYHARVADSALLDYIGASSTAVTQASFYGAVATVIDTLMVAASGIRSRNRMPAESRFRVLLPNWAKSAIAQDVVNTEFGRFDVTPPDVDALLRTYGFNPTWYRDTQTGAGQLFGAQAAGALITYPTTLVAYLFPEGSFLFLDGGTLDLGIVRDSVLNATNDFQIFAETFEAAAFVGVESLKITMTTFCANGVVAPRATSAITC